MYSIYLKRLLAALTRVLVLLCLLCCFPGLIFAEEKALPLHYTANTQGLSGVELWYANLYNNNRFSCALVTILIIPVVGFILGSVADFFISRTGLDLKSRAK